MRIRIPDFETQKDLFAYLIENKDRILTQKKAFMIYSEAFKAAPFFGAGDDVTVKGEPISQDATKIKVKLVINTTNYMDSHKDVHLPGLWTKTLKENKGLYLLESHKSDFDHVISDELDAYTATVSWKSLGYDQYEGKTEALMFDAVLEKERNPKMFKAYARRWVKNHSVGMQYIKVDMAINHKDYKSEKALFDELIDDMANKEEAVKCGYFFAVKEARAFEGSAVLRGSNDKTPTQEVEEFKDETTEVEPAAPLERKSAAMLINNFLK
jgi:hypothetical protein